MLKTAFRATGLAIALSTVSLAAQAETHRVAFHVDQNDPQLMNMTLNNVNNLIAYYTEQGDEVEVQVVTYGPGLHMLRADTSPVAPRIAQMSLEHDNVTFQACNNTLQGMQRQAGHDIELLTEANIVPSGVVQLVTLQEQGWTYIRP
jgi:Uncharacterized conserved protein